VLLLAQDQAQSEVAERIRDLQAEASLNLTWLVNCPSYFESRAGTTRVCCSLPALSAFACRHERYESLKRSQEQWSKRETELNGAVLVTRLCVWLAAKRPHFTLVWCPSPSLAATIDSLKSESDEEEKRHESLRTQLEALKVRCCVQRSSRPAVVDSNPFALLALVLQATTEFVSESEVGKALAARTKVSGGSHRAVFSLCCLRVLAFSRAASC
jgi:hypothetical protein